jgi:hypothetical protein
MKRPRLLEDAAATIEPGSLEKAKAAILSRCEEYLAVLERMGEALELKVHTADDERRFAKALAMYQLAYLPTRPETCPFCVQHSGGERCEGCGYALTHGGRCDADTSSFGRLIESAHELAGLIYLIAGDAVFGACRGRRLLRRSIQASRTATRDLMKDLPDASAFRLMEIKAEYIVSILGLIPVELIDPSVKEKRAEVVERAGRYW